MNPTIQKFFEFLRDKEGKGVPIPAEQFKTAMLDPSTDFSTLANRGVVGNVNLANNKEITKLPEGMFFSGNVLLNETSLTEIPKGSKFNKQLDLNGTKVETLPPDIYVRGSLFLFRTPLRENLVTQGLKTDSQRIIYLKKQYPGLQGYLIYI